MSHINTYGDRKIEVVFNEALTLEKFDRILWSLFTLCTKKENAFLLVNASLLRNDEYLELLKECVVDYDLNAFEKELKVLQSLGGILKRIALLAEPAFCEFLHQQFSKLPEIEIRHFSSDHIAEAKAWLYSFDSGGYSSVSKHVMPIPGDEGRSLTIHNENKQSY